MKEGKKIINDFHHFISPITFVPGSYMPHPSSDLHFTTDPLESYKYQPFVNPLDSTVLTRLTNQPHRIALKKN